MMAVMILFFLLQVFIIKKCFLCFNAEEAFFYLK